MSGKGKRSSKKGGPEPAAVYRVVTELEGDLWTSPKSHSIAHCVAEDLRMGAGIAVGFKQNFKGVDDLASQRVRVGHVAVLRDEERFVYYLVTKKASNGKPHYDDLYRCLGEMRAHCVEHAVRKLSMPRIGCGLDRLEWKEVKPKIEEIFTGAGVDVTVYNFQQGYGKHNPKPEPLVVDAIKDKKERKKPKSN